MFKKLSVKHIVIVWIVLIIFIAMVALMQSTPAAGYDGPPGFVFETATMYPWMELTNQNSQRGYDATATARAVKVDPFAERTPEAPQVIYFPSSPDEPRCIDLPFLHYWMCYDGSSIWMGEKK